MLEYRDALRDYQTCNDLTVEEQALMVSLALRDTQHSVEVIPLHSKLASSEVKLVFDGQELEDEETRQVLTFPSISAAFNYLFIILNDKFIRRSTFY